MESRESVVLKCINMIDLISDYTLKQEKKRGESIEEITKRIQFNKIKKNKYKSYMTGNKGPAGV